MKIALWYNLASGGAKRALHAHVRGLLARGHAVEIWCPPTADRSYLPLADLAPEHVVPLDADIPISRRGLARYTTGYQEVCRRLEAMDRHSRACAEQINAGGFDVFVAHPCTQFRVTSIGRYIQIPKLLYIQEPYRLLYEASPRLPWLAPPAERSWWRSPRYCRRYAHEMMNLQGMRVQAREEVDNAAAYDQRLVNSYFSRESILRAYGQDADVCYLGVDTEMFYDQGREREPFVIGIGAFVPAKNVEFVIEAIATIPSAKRPRLVWIGNFADPDYIGRLESLADKRSVVFEPRASIPDEEIVELLNRASVMAYAPRLEPFGYAPLEANACGLPVVAVAEGGVRETVQEGVNGLLVPPHPAAMGEALLRILGEKNLAATLGRQARRIAEERWSESAALDRIESFLRSATAAGTSSNGTRGGAL